MSSIGWRFLVLADLGGKDSSVDLEVKGKRVHLELRDEKAFEPAALAAHGDPNDILHHPSFHAVESSFRGLKLLREHAAGAIEIEVLSVSRAELVERFRREVFDRESREVSGRPIALILADFDFSGRGADLTALESLADMALGLQAPLVAGAAPGFFDLSRWDMLPKLSDLPSRLAKPALAGWQKFQREDRARWLALTVNRHLQRAPYADEKVDPA